MKPSQSEFLEINGRRCHVRRWGQPGARQLFLLHGWLDTSVTFQFLVDCFQKEWDIIAPDWPGYGDSERRHQQYYMQDDVVLLDALLDHYSPDAPATLVGHSYGGQVATLFSGARPDRVRHYVSIEGFGPHQQPLSAAPRSMASWLDRTRKARGGSRYPGYGALAQRLIVANPRLTQQRADFLARGIGRPCAEDSAVIELQADPWRRLRGMPLSFPTAAYFETFLGAIAAPALWLRGDSSHYMAYVFPEHQLYQDRFQHLSHGLDVLIEEAGHNLHHDQPEQLAKHIERFLSPNYSEPQRHSTAE
ncbi:alpha/beta fold hydrolase [Marinobacter vinifirmus]|uniref:Alpha/beta hydrolase n=1 Tax=Marinobacter vinifirmus TaxID=355591 RepID=A0A558B2E6_9GAMM|nr:alpha/beta hydrolase [Marinobacter vinifirmus]TVT30685.1 MAG: alpha/beta hydrolase [Marinobacter vinifirmus]